MLGKALAKFIIVAIIRMAFARWVAIKQSSNLAIQDIIMKVVARTIGLMQS